MVTFTAAPIVATRGNAATIFAPARYKGIGGPGTLLVVRSDARAACASTGTGTNQLTSASGSAMRVAGAPRHSSTSSCAAAINSSMPNPASGISNRAMDTALDACALRSPASPRRLIGTFTRNWGTS